MNGKEKTHKCWLFLLRPEAGCVFSVPNTDFYRQDSKQYS